MLPHLPAQPTPFVGRETELRDLKVLLDQSDTHLVTILGIGGVGKSRLALAAAEQQYENFASHVYFIPLASLNSWDQIAFAIAQAIGFQLYQNIPIHEQLSLYLCDKRMLLVLDNVEHLLPDVNFISDVLTIAPHLKFLVTSRERLNLRGEIVFTIEGFTVDNWRNTAEASQSDAIHLFLQVAQRAEPKFSLTSEHLPGIRRTCRLVDGIPLGIELAAGWVALMSPDEIADEIEHNYKFLETDTHDLPTRHRSLSAIFNSTWDRMTLEERDTLSKISMFPNGFTRRAAQRVTGANIRTLQSLMNRSLLKRTEHGVYQIHRLLRQFAASHLEQNAQDILLNAHSQYYLTWLNELEANIKGKAQREALDEIQQEFDNVSMAWIHAYEHLDLAILDQGLEGLFWFCFMRNRYLEGETLFQQAETRLARESSDEAAALTARIQLRRLWLKRWREGSLAAEPDISAQLETILALFRRIGKTEGIALCLLLLGDVSHATKNVAADAYMQESIELYQILDDEFYIAWVMHFMARQALSRAGLAQAVELQQQSLLLCRQHGNLNGVIYTLYNLSTDYLQLGELEQSISTAQEMMELSRQMGERSGEFMATTTLSLVACLRAEFDRADALSQDVLRLATEMNHLLGKAYGLVVQCLLLLMRDQTAQARTILGQLDKLATHRLARFFCNLCGAIAACNIGEWDNAAQYLGDALRYAISVRSTYIMHWCFLIGAVWSHAQEDPKGAERLLRLGQPEHNSQLFSHWTALEVVRDEIDAISERSDVKAPETDAEIEAAAKRLLQQLTLGNEETSLPAHVLAANRALQEPLSIRELEVLASIAEGLSNQQIAANLTVEISTVKKHITNIYGKLGVGSRTQAILRAQQLSLV